MIDSYCKCKLCGLTFLDSEMSEEHYPAKSVGNDDIVAVNIADIFSEETLTEVSDRIKVGENPVKIADDIFDTKLSKPIYPNGRTARTLCKTCNTFLGKYDRAYMRFFEADGLSVKTKGFQQKTKLQIIKAIYGKFLSVPETKDEEFDFIEFVRNEQLEQYDGKWRLYFIKRNYTSDLLGFKSLNTGKAEFDEGIVYEFSDDKFIFNLMNFDKHECYSMTNIFDILNKNYTIVEGVDDSGGYHGQIMLLNLFKQIRLSEGED